jgi:hypothetical protein
MVFNLQHSGFTLGVFIASMVTEYSLYEELFGIQIFQMTVKEAYSVECVVMKSSLQV